MLAYLAASAHRKKKLYKIFLEIKFHNGNIKEGIFYYTPIP